MSRADAGVQTLRFRLRALGKHAKNLLRLIDYSRVAHPGASAKNCFVKRTLRSNSSTRLDKHFDCPFNSGANQLSAVKLKVNTSA